MASSPLSSSHDHGHHAHPISMYVKTFLALGLFMVLTIAASFVIIPSVHLGPITISGNFLNNAVALGIASVKAWIVVMFFMHTKWATNLTKLWAMAGFVWFFLLFMTFGDYATRKYEPVPGWEPIVDGALPRDQVRESVPAAPDNVNVRPRW